MPERKDAIDASNREAKLESQVDQNRTKQDPAEHPANQAPNNQDEPKNPIPAPKDLS